VSIMIFVRFANVRVVEKRACCLFQIGLMGSPFLAELTATEELVAEMMDGDVSDQPNETEGVVAAPVEISMTGEQIAIEKDVPCRLDVGRKFEYVISDIHEALRRHHLINPKLRREQISMDSRLTSPNIPAWVTSIDIEPSDFMTSAFAGYAGHIKARIFCSEMGLDAKAPVGHPILVKCYNRSENSNVNEQFGWMAMQKGSCTAKEADWYKTLTLGSSDLIASPVEMMYPLSPTSGYIDISLPFNWNENFIRLNANRESTIMATVLVRTFSSNPLIEVFQAIGDDFKYGIYHGPTCNLRLPETTGAVPANHGWFADTQVYTL
jgi:hypothetical protein